MIAKDLKAALLQEAVQGKLVPQVASEGSARDLLAQIRMPHGLDFANAKSGSKKNAVVEPVARLRTSGSEVTTIPDEEKPCLPTGRPFDIPQNWCWCRLEEIASVTTGITPLKSEIKFYENGTIPWITSSLTNKDFINDSETFITNYALENTNLNIYPVHTLILAMYGQGKTRGQISELLFPATINQACAAIELYSKEEVLRKYIKFFHKWNYDRIRKESSGSAQPNLNLSKVQNTYIPLPPLAEQKRIVAALEKMLPLVEEYGKKEKALTKLNADISSLAKKTVLQEAVQGKLVPQIESEGNARDLLNEIEKSRHAELDSASVKNREKTLANKEQTDLFAPNGTHSKKAKTVRSEQIRLSIPDEEKPFDIPQSWCWCRLGDLGTFVRGNGIKRSETVPDGFPCVRYGEMYTTYRTKFERTKSFTTKDIFDKCQKIKTNDILMALTGENKWDIALAAVYQGDEELALGGDLCKFTPLKTDSLFLVYLINSPYGIESKRNVATGDIIVHISAEKLSNLLIPLPPLAEQKRIVAALEKILPLCERLGK